ncbi:MAG: sensor protein KdpD [Bacteroidales bacterium]|jgi:two-component system sensor histidine kinase KdpD
MQKKELKDNNVERFLELIKKSRRGKFKLYVGMIAGVGKSYRMLEEARSLLENNVDCKIGYIETHGRKETEKLLEGLPIIPRRKIFYKGKELDELDTQAILSIRPEIVIIDELAHSNIPGSKNEKRWQDVNEILEAGINVISAVNIQHIEGLSNEIEKITGIEIKEKIPDSVLRMADEIVNIDLTAEELINRLKQGKIYDPSKIEIALNNFFREEKILQLRELALREVAGQVERKIETEVFSDSKLKPEKFLACISTNEKVARKIISKTSRIANFYAAKWYVLYVQTPGEAFDKIGLAEQRHLLDNLKLATELGAEVIKIKNNKIGDAIFSTAEKMQITTILIGLPTFSYMKFFYGRIFLNKLLKKISGTKMDLLIVS